MDLIKELHEYLVDDIKVMNKVIIDSLAVDEELISLISNHLSSSGGKRIRPILTLLVAKIYGYSGDNSIKLAAAVEFIHMATLLHDDVIDGSKMRRFMPTANQIWGSRASILVGDFLFSQSFKLIVSTKSQKSLEILSTASAIIAEGEVSQLAQLSKQEIITEASYLKVINAKTAELFGASCGIGAVIAKADDSIELMINFGKKIGNLFQIRDDFLDYFSTTNQVGKNIGDDFYEGKVTLPLILLNKKLSILEKNIVTKLLQKKERSLVDFEQILSLMKKYNIKTDIESYLQTLKQKADDNLLSINSNCQNKKYLNDILNFSMIRNY